MTNLDYCLADEPRWNYKTYRLIMWIWMMNEIAIVFAPVDMSHNGFYLHVLLYAVAAIFIGIPLVYSEICIVQYTNCNVISMWNFMPILKGVGWASMYLVLLKIIYLNVLSSWYMIFTVYASFDPPPWFTCIYYNDPMCIIKSVNVSTFRHCIETQILFNDDCGIKTASKCFFDREIANNNIKNIVNTFLWKPFVATFISSAFVLIVYGKRETIINIIVRFLALYLGLAVFLLLWVALSSDGIWYITKNCFEFEEFQYENYITTLQRGFLSCGTGYGVIGYLTYDVSFRSPATMTSVAVTLFSLFISIMLSLIIFIGIKTMSYYHGLEDKVIEEGETIFFKPFASIAEIFTYFNKMSVWGFIWFSTIYLFLLLNLWILFSVVVDNIQIQSKTANKYPKLICVVIMAIIQALSYAFYYSDLTSTLTEVTEILQLLSSLLFSISIYWIYGFKNHNIDITFMIGIKASYFWKIVWILNPLFVFANLYLSWKNLKINENNVYINDLSLEFHSNKLLFYILISLYFCIIIVGAIYQLRVYFIHYNIKYIFLPDPSWGPQHEILFKSRKMFAPQIMTREFLYRQVKIHGYCKKNSVQQEERNTNNFEELPSDKVEWNALTSN